MTSPPGPDGLRRVLIDHISAVYADGQAVAEDTSLFYSGMIDSLGIADLALVIGRTLGRPFAGADIVAHDLDTIGRLVAFCHAGTAAPAPTRAGLPAEDVFTVIAPGMVPGSPGIQVQAYLQLPEGGWDPQGRLVVLLHGLGGLPDHLVYKSSRLALAQAGHAVLSVAYRGGEMFLAEDAYVLAQISAVVTGFLSQPALRGHLLSSKDGTAELEIPRGVLSAIPSAMVKAELDKPWSDRCFDFGGYQAVDVLCCLDAVRRRYGTLPRTYLCAESMGMQVALGCIRFAPGTFDGILELGGAYYTEHNRPFLRDLFTTTDVLMTHRMPVFVSIMVRDIRIIVKVHCQQPVICRDGAGPGGTGLEDEIDLRQSDLGWSAPPHPGFRIDSIAGAEDHYIAESCRRKLQQDCAERGIESTLRLIGASDVDGEIFVNTGHTCFGRLDQVVRALAVPWLAQREGGGRPPVGELGTQAEQRLPATSGAWLVRYAPAPHLTFVPGVACQP